ncbi:MAG TPA: lytic transglycosylase domain-containing protein [Stellaceae bacterium]|nr:lytic transglycosylase domain-containing protein [Stellaceae bacterium]
MTGIGKGILAALVAVLAAPGPGAGAGTLGPGSSLIALDRLAFAVDGAESSHGADPRMWRPDPDGPQGPMQVSAAAAADVGGGNRFDETVNRALGRAYLARLYHRYGSWPDAVTAYNWGPGRTDDWIDSGRRSDKMPMTVALYRFRVLNSAQGGSAAAPPLRRLGIVHPQPRRPLADRRHPSADSRAVERLYGEIMRISDNGASR